MAISTIAFSPSSILLSPRTVVVLPNFTFFSIQLEKTRQIMAVIDKELDTCLFEEIFRFACKHGIIVKFVKTTTTTVPFCYKLHLEGGIRKHFFP